MQDGGKNDPLPVRSKEAVESMARSVVDSLADAYALKTDSRTVNKEFFRCIGQHNETADDGRFFLDYAVRAPLPEGEHGKAVRAMRKILEAEGYRISGYREDRTKKPWALMDAKGGRDNLSVTVQSSDPPTRITFMVTTGCFLPPGVKQQQLSAPAPDAAPGAPEDPRLALMAPVRSVPAGNPFG